MARGKQRFPSDSFTFEGTARVCVFCGIIFFAKYNNIYTGNLQNTSDL